MFINFLFHQRIFIYLFKTASITFLSYILFELLDDDHGTPISQKNVKCNSPGLELAIDPTSAQGNFVLKNFPKQLITPLSDLSCKDFAIC